MIKLNKEDKVFIYCLVVVCVIYFIFSFQGVKLKLDNNNNGVKSDSCPPFIMPRHPPTPALPSISPEAMANKEILSSILIDHVTSLNKYIREVKSRNSDVYNTYVACRNGLTSVQLPEPPPPPEEGNSSQIRELENLN